MKDYNMEHLILYINFLRNIDVLKLDNLKMSRQIYRQIFTGKGPCAFLAPYSRVKTSDLTFSIQCYHIYL